MLTFDLYSKTAKCEIPIIAIDMVTPAARRPSPPNPDVENIKENLITQDSDSYYEQLNIDSR